MPTVRLTESGSDSYRAVSDGLSVERGETVEVGAERAEYLVKHQGFEYVDGLASFDADDSDETEPETYTCDECGDAFDTPQGLGAHSRSHT